MNRKSGWNFSHKKAQTCYLCSRVKCVWMLSNKEQWMVPVMKLLTLSSRPTSPHPARRCWDWDPMEVISPLPAGPQSGAARQTEGREHALSCFACCSGQCLSNGLHIKFPALPTLLESALSLSLQGPHWAVPPPQRSELELLVGGASSNLYSNNSISCPAPQY